MKFTKSFENFRKFVCELGPSCLLADIGIQKRMHISVYFSKTEEGNLYVIYPIGSDHNVQYQISMCDKCSMLESKNAKTYYHDFSRKIVLQCDLCQKSRFRET